MSPTEAPARRGALWLVRSVALLSWVAGAGWACGDAYSSHVPRQKTEVPLVLSPDNVRAGDVYSVQAIVFSPNEANYISDYDFGDGLDVLDFDTGGGAGCAEVDTSGLQVPNLFETTHVFPVCLTVSARAEIGLGERVVELDVESDGEPIVARATFYVLPALP